MTLPLLSPFWALDVIELADISKRSLESLQLPWYRWVDPRTKLLAVGPTCRWPQSRPRLPRCPPRRWRTRRPRWERCRLVWTKKTTNGDGTDAFVGTFGGMIAGSGGGWRVPSPPSRIRVRQRFLRQGAEPFPRCFEVFGSNPGQASNGRSEVTEG